MRPVAVTGLTRHDLGLDERERPEPVFRARLRAPTLPRHFVRRQRLLALLDDLADYPVTAIVAPAGTGKTALASDWSRHTGSPGAWVTLDAADAGVAALWRSLLDALDVLAPGTVASANGHLRPGPNASALLAHVPQSASGTPPRVLVIDAIDRLADADGAAGALLASFVENRPAWLRLMLLSRRRLPLPVDRLRASGELVDVDFGALRFSGDEAAQLLDSLCSGLPRAELTAAADRADGWAAALQLGSLALRSRRADGAVLAVAPEPRAERLVEEYLWGEVLRRERPELVALLHSAAVVGRVSYGLAAALTERPDAGDMLEEAVASGLFLTAGDDGWFEVHSLVRTMLVARMAQRWPAGLREQHARAAQWFEAEGDRSAALDHWLLAACPKDALRVLAQLLLPLIETGRSARVVAALAQIPPVLVTADAQAALRYAWCQLAVGRSDFLDALSVAESTVDAPTATAPGTSRRRVEILQAAAASLRVDWFQAAAQARRALDARAHRPVGDPVERFGWHLVSCGIALEERWDDRTPAVGEARAACLADPVSRWSFEGVRAVGLALAGRPLEARRLADAMRRPADGEEHETLRVGLALAGAVADRELDDRPSPHAVLEELASIPAHLDPALAMVAQLELVRLQMSAGDVDAAAARLDEAEAWRARLAAQVPTGEPWTATSSTPDSLLARAGVDLALAVDDTTTAARWAEQVADPFWAPACEAMIHLARGGQSAALECISRAVPRCPRHEVVAGLLRGQALARHDHAAATLAVGSALDLAVRHAMLRTVAWVGPPVFELVELSAWRVPEAWLDRLRHTLVPVWTGHDAHRLVDDLTERERDVLRLLPSRLTLTEIAAELFVSQNTLKFHLRAIYRKLGADSRAQAVDAARQMRLLPRG